MAAVRSAKKNDRAKRRKAKRHAQILVSQHIREQMDEDFDVETVEGQVKFDPAAETKRHLGLLAYYLVPVESDSAQEASEHPKDEEKSSGHTRSRRQRRHDKMVAEKHTKEAAAHAKLLDAETATGQVNLSVEALEEIADADDAAHPAPESESESDDEAAANRRALGALAYYLVPVSRAVREYVPGESVPKSKNRVSSRRQKRHEKLVADHHAKEAAAHAKLLDAETATGQVHLSVEALEELADADDAAHPAPEAESESDDEESAARRALGALAYYLVPVSRAVREYVPGESAPKSQNRTKSRRQKRHDKLVADHHEKEEAAQAKLMDAETSTGQAILPLDALTDLADTADAEAAALAAELADLAIAAARERRQAYHLLPIRRHSRTRSRRQKRHDARVAAAHAKEAAELAARDPDTVSGQSSLPVKKLEDSRLSKLV